MGKPIIRNLQSNEGYSMVELLVTMAILVIIATPLASYFVVGAQNNRIARQQMQAAQMAQQAMEEWKASEVIGNPPSTEDIGEFRITRTFAPEDRPSTDTITYPGVNQPPVVLGDPVPAPVQRPVTDYQYAAVNGLPDSMPVVANVMVENTVFPGSFDLTVGGGIPQTISTGFILNLSLSPVDSVNSQATFSGAGIISQAISFTTPLPAGTPARVEIIMNCPAAITLNVTTTGPFTEVYVFQGVDEAGVNYPDMVNAFPGSSDVQIFENLNQSPAIDSQRIYRLTVTVSRNGNQLVQLVSNKRIE